MGADMANEPGIGELDITDELIALELMVPRKEGVTVFFDPKYPLHISPWIIPRLYPEGKEAEMMAAP